MKYTRVCPRCLNQHKTTAKSNKAICDKCKKLKKTQTKKYLIKQARKELKLKDTAWSLEIRKDPCLICSTTINLHAHHLIPREIKETRHLYQNGVSLCVTHHKYSYEVSAHKNSAMFLLVLRQKNAAQYNWLIDTLLSLQLKYEDKNGHNN